MEVQTDKIIDLSLTIAQALCAGLLAVLLYSWRNRSNALTAGSPETNTVTSIPVAVQPAAREVTEGKHTIQFVSLAPKSEPQLGRIRDSLIEARRRNRADIIRQARQMIEQGTTNREITQRLRMTDGELALLRQDINR